MKLVIAFAATAALAVPAAPALAHCKTVHHRASAKVVHRVAWRAPVRRAACACGTAHHAAYRPARLYRPAPLYRPALYREAYYAPPPPPLYRPVYRPRVVTVVYERPVYRPHYRPLYARPAWRPPLYRARYERFGPPRFHRYAAWAGHPHYWR